MSESEAKVERLSNDLTRTKKDNDELSDQIKMQRELLAEVDRERDVFQMQMDQKEIRLVDLEGTTVYLTFASSIIA